MIVDPSFPDHHKTLMLIEATGDKSAAMLVIRLWGFCQLRKRWTLEGITPDALKAITHWVGNGLDLVNHLKAIGFLDEENGVLTVHDWAEVNHQLVTNWDNAKFGKRGGRPKSNLEKPIGLPMGTLWVPKGAPIGVDKIREEVKSASKTRKVFEKPNASDCCAYAIEVGIPSAEGENFWNHHEARGWVMGNGKHMVDWKAAFRTWKSNYFKFNKITPSTSNRPKADYSRGTGIFAEMPPVEPVSPLEAAQ